jgi:hypothetical protein
MPQWASAQPAAAPASQAKARSRGGSSACFNALALLSLDQDGGTTAVSHQPIRPEAQGSGLIPGGMVAEGPGDVTAGPM